ncbi:MAG: IPT/TIG domain-containing protein [Leptospira sp.]|nr:IPT/TIG domain-containing protein [Leptospira sp.]
MRIILRKLTFILIALNAIHCPTPKKADQTETLLPLLTLSRGTGTSSSTDASGSTGNSPTISSMTAVSGAYPISNGVGVMEGGSVTITGTNFASTTSGNTVTWGGQTLTITSASTTSLTVTAPQVSSNSSSTVSVSVSGRSGSSSGSLSILDVSSISLATKETPTLGTSIQGVTGTTPRTKIYKANLTAGTYLVNAFGGAGSNNYQIYINNSFSLSGTLLATSASNNTGTAIKFNLPSTADVYIEIYASAANSTSTVNLIVVSQASFGSSSISCNGFAGASRCYNVPSYHNNFTSTTCTGSLGGTYSGTQNCAAVNTTGTVVGTCLVPFTDVGPLVLSYYSNGGTPYTAGTANTHCTTTVSTNAVFF